MRGALPAPYMHAQTQSLHLALALDFILRATRRLISSWRFMAVSFVSAWSTPTQARAAATRGHSSPDGTKAQSESSIPIEEMIQGAKGAEVGLRCALNRLAREE